MILRNVENRLVIRCGVGMILLPGVKIVAKEKRVSTYVGQIPRY